MRKSSLVLVALLLASPVFADDVKSEQLLTLAAADIGASVSVQTAKEADLASDSDQEVKFYGRLLSAKLAANLPAQLVKETAVNVKF